MIDTGDGVPWLLDAGSPSLDFAYTADWGTGLDRWDLLRSTADLGHWLAERYPGADPRAVHDGELRDALALRDAISTLAVAFVDGKTPARDAIDTLNLYAAAPDVPPVLAGGRRQAGASRIRTAQALSSIARDAVSIFHEEQLPRLRRCAADDCRMIYRDESRTGSRRWCSMQRCGNRAKVRAHRARQAARSAAAG